MRHPSCKGAPHAFIRMQDPLATGRSSFKCSCMLNLSEQPAAHVEVILKRPHGSESLRGAGSTNTARCAGWEFLLLSQACSGRATHLQAGACYCTPYLHSHGRKKLTRASYCGIERVAEFLGTYVAAAGHDGGKGGGVVPVAGQRGASSPSIVPMPSEGPKLSVCVWHV